MTLDNIREKIAIKLTHNENWVNTLDETIPGHYGVNNYEVTLDLNDVWVDIPTQTFKFKNAQFNFDLVLGSSNDGIEDSFSRTANGKGTFTFAKDDKIEIEDVTINVDLDLYQ